MFLFQSPLHFSTEPESDLSDLLGFFVMLHGYRYASWLSSCFVIFVIFVIIWGVRGEGEWFLGGFVGLVGFFV